MPPQLILEVYRFRILKDIFSTSKSRKIVAFAEFHMKNKTFRSAECHVNSGSQYCLPWSDEIDEVFLHFYYIDDLLAVEVGSAIYELKKDKQFLSDGSNMEVILPVKLKGSIDRVGKVMLNISVQAMYEDEPQFAKPARPETAEYNLSVPGFRFRRLTRSINWERVRALHLDRVVQNNDTHSLLACLDDLATGDVSQEDVDPKLHKLLQMEQYSIQYLLECHNLLKSKEKIVNTAIKQFDEEEQLLDLKIAKMRARQKALERESRDCDGICSDYTALLRDLNPRLIDNLYRSYKSKQYRDSMPDPESSLGSFDASEDLKYAAHTKILTVPRSHNSKERHRDRDRDRDRNRDRDSRYDDRDHHDSHHRDSRQDSKRRASEDIHSELSTSSRSAISRDHRHHDHRRDERREGRDYSREEYYDRIHTRDDSKDEIMQRKDRSTSEHKTRTKSIEVEQKRDRTTSHTSDLQPQQHQPQSRSKAPSKDYNWVQQPVVDPWVAATVDKSEEVRGDSPPPIQKLYSKSTSSELSVNPPVKIPSVVGEASVTPSPVVLPTKIMTPAPLVIEVDSDEDVKPAIESTVSDDQIITTGEGFKTVPRIVTVNRTITVGGGATAAPSAVVVPSMMPSRSSGSPLSLSDDEEQDGLDLVSRLAAQKGQPTTGTNRQSVASTTAMSVDSLNPQQSVTIEGRGVLSRGNSNNTPFAATTGSMAVSVPKSSHDNSESDEEDGDRNKQQQAGSKLNMTYPQSQSQSKHTSSSTSSTQNAKDEDAEDHYSDDANEYDNEEFEASVSQADIVTPVASAGPKIQPKTVNEFKRAESKGDKSADSRPGRGNKHSHSDDDEERSDIESDDDVKQAQRKNPPLTVTTSITSLSDAKHADGSFPTFDGMRESTDAPLTRYSDDEDDDPFGFGTTPKHGASSANRDAFGRSKNNNLSTLEAESDIDTSRSVIIDFTLPSSNNKYESVTPVQKSINNVSKSAEPKSFAGGNRTGVINYLQSKGMNNNNKNHMSDEDVGESDFELSQSRDHNPDGELSLLADTSGNQFAFSSLAARSVDDDNVLLGTMKGPARGGAMSTNTLRSQHSVEMFDKFDKDSLAGTGKQKSDGSNEDGGDIEMDESFNDFMTRPSIESPWNKGSSTPVTPGGGPYTVGEDESSMFMDSPEKPIQRMGSLKKQTAITSISLGDEKGPCRWVNGRATLEQIEMAKAFDVYVSAIRLDDGIIYMNPDVMIKLLFLGVTSKPSNAVAMQSSDIQPFSFSSHMLFNEENIDLLKNEISDFQESLCFQIHVFSAEALDGHVMVAQANVNLWVMVEDSINILRQEVDLFSADDSDLVGSIMVDVRGYRLLQRCR